MEVAVSRKFFAFTPSMPLVLGWIRFLFDSNSSSLTYWSHIFLKNDKIIQFLILRNRHSTIKAILTARFGEVEVAVGRKFNCALTVVLCREWRLEESVEACCGRLLAPPLSWCAARADIHAASLFFSLSHFCVSFKGSCARSNTPLLCPLQAGIL